MKLGIIFGIILGIILISGFFPFSISDSEVQPFKNPNAVEHMSETAIDKIDNLPESKSKAHLAHEKITQFMKEKNKIFPPTAKPSGSNNEQPQVSFDKQLPVFATFVNETSKELVVGLDYKSANKNYDYYKSKIFEVVGEDIPFKLITGFFVEEACTSQIDDCRPIWGGIEMSPATGAGTLTLPFVTNDDEIGFIVSGHVVGTGTTQNVFQPEINSPISDHVGSVITNPGGPRASDAAFVETLPGKTLALEIFKSSGQSYKVIDTKTSSETPISLQVFKMGITTDESTAGILSKNISVAGGQYNLLTNQVSSGYLSAAGDSGAPIFEKSTGDDVYFLGIHRGKACFSDFPPTIQIIGPQDEAACLSMGGNFPSIYSPWEGIQDDLDLADFDDICSPPSSGSWTINQSCMMISDATISGNVLVNSPAVVKIPDGVTLDIDFNNQKTLTIKSGAGILIKQGGAIT